jgi:hypothetical protein
MERDANGLTIECIPTGRNGKATLTARLGGEAVAVQSLDLSKPKLRQEFRDAVCHDRPGIDPKAVDAELLQLAADLASKPDEPQADADAAEIDVSRLVRPERFILPDVSGLAVPTMIVIGDKPAGRWQLYLRWADGRRERRTMPQAIELPGSKKVWIHPEPAEPTATMQAGWSKAARAAWLKGAAVPAPADVFKRMCERIAHFIDLPQQHAPGIGATLAIWSMLTYCYQAWDALPYLNIGGPLGSGKTRLFEILARLAFRPFGSSNLTAAGLFRTLHTQGGTLLLDEAERLKQAQCPDVAELLSMLLAGYKRGGQATRLEPLGDTGRFKTVSFDVFGPKALAGIAGLPPNLASRCIVVTMFRASRRSETPRRRIDTDPSGWQRLRDDLHALAMEHGPAWLELARRTDVCPRMGGRDFELWQPLLGLASWIESHGARGLHGLLQEHALATIERGRDESVPDADETLLRILADAVRAGDHLTPSEILAKALEAEPVVFKLWQPRTVTARLKSYGIPIPKKVDSGRRREFRDVTPEALRRIQESYGIDLDLPEADGKIGTV